MSSAVAGVSIAKVAGNIGAEIDGVNFGTGLATDTTYTDRPPAITMLRTVMLPPYGGDHRHKIRRCVIAGDVPVGVKGQPSVSRTGTTPDPYLQVLAYA